MSLTPEHREALLRWRLALGPRAEEVDRGLGLDALRAEAERLAIDPGRLDDLDQALGFVYDDNNKAKIPQAVADEMKALTKQIVDGTIQVPVK